MFKKGKEINRFVMLAINLFAIIVIGLLDYMTGEQLSFSFFYLIPISLFSLYKNTKHGPVIISSVFASVIWFLIDDYSRDYTSIFFPIWNAFVRLTIFNVIGLLIVNLKETQKEMSLINKHLKAINEEKNKFIGITAHDIRSPISGIYSFSDLLITNYQDKVDPEILEIIGLIKTISSNTLVILKNLLDISKIESGRVELKIKNQDYSSFLEQQISLSRIIAKQKNISIVFQNQTDSLMIDFDENYLGEVVDNLLSNAIKYSYRNSEIVVRLSRAGDREILTEVIDRGHGIPEAEQQKLFNYFQRTSTLPTDGEHSTGLGLAIAKRIANLHHGEIGVKSILNEGSTFYFTLPIKQDLTLIDSMKPAI